MAIDYARLQAVAIRLIDENGKAGTIVRSTLTGPPHAPTVTEAPYACRLVETDNKATNWPDSLLQVGDRMGLISPDVSVTLDRLSDRVVIDGARLSLIELRALNPGGTLMLYKFLARA